MARYLEVLDCGDCPSRGHAGGLGRPAFIPRCEATGQLLPYTVEAGQREADATNVIPDWCPLATGARVKEIELAHEQEIRKAKLLAKVEMIKTLPIVS